ncbi:unnamed protein product [Phytomonas sp. Hart1]|nr:unnamed protein product [Phytomonas sp. Hart1]|eukprot:CCW68466.1 unnamed protein product [Phytomonas sp. isolate Hart1]
MTQKFDFHDLSNEAIRSMLPSEALQKHLENAQLAHRICVAKALKAEESVEEQCSLTWGEVLLRYNQWANYRPPFEFSEAKKKYNAFWTPKRLAAEEANPLK